MVNVVRFMCVTFSVIGFYKRFWISNPDAFLSIFHIPAARNSGSSVFCTALSLVEPGRVCV